MDLSKATSVTVKIGNTAGFLTEIDVAVSSLLHPTDGRIDVVIDSKISSELPVGQYLLEVWIDDAHGNTAIYPDTSYPSVIGFSIKKNIMTATSTVITTLTLADFEAKFDDLQKDLQDKVTSGYFKGDKGDKGDTGDTGSVDNDGLTAAPAFVELQTQVDNSAVGINLLINTSSSSTNGRTVVQGTTPTIYGVYSRTDSYEQVTTPVPDEFYYRFMQADTNNLYGLTPGETYTLSGSGSHTSGELKFRAQYGTGSNWSGSDLGDLGIPVSDGSVFTPFSHTFTIPVGATGVFFSLQNYDYASSSLFRFKKMKLEKGSVATDWCPNPSEILTQSDYAKIQAAIVALGGSL
ncbi:prophage Lp2 protein 53 [Paucilactobacillus suebicus DSM 5007 = KCTC 3549]|uniref:Prophage Lp2 protein 53 n=1 Tax=Paucilactobacillus suebicus DSM 5007 = KCTC 3549 TaxID=1423807 RepID=A0A0R1VSY8_9LACO|nr:prophage Lp2 protein 53 [Paucilactobacillus suebicus DSM 5007 = KCTC 3549]